MRATYVPEWTEAPLFVRPSQETVAAPACNVTGGRGRPDDRPRRRLDTGGHRGRPGELELRDHSCPAARDGERRRYRLGEAERGVERERPLERRRLSAIVCRAQDPAPESLGLEGAVSGAAGPCERVRAGRRLAGEHGPRRSVRGDEIRRNRRRPHELVGERLALGDVVAVRRDDRSARQRRVDPRVHHQQRLRDRPLRARRGVEQLPVEGHRRRAAAVEGGAGDHAEPYQRERELEVRHAARVAAAAAVDHDEHDPPVGELPNGGTWLGERELAGNERLAGVEHRLAGADERGPAPDGIDDAGPVGLEHEAHTYGGARGRLIAKTGSCSRAPGNQHCAIGWDRRNAAAPDFRHGSRDLDVRQRRRERPQHDLQGSWSRGRDGPPRGCVQRSAARGRRVVDGREVLSLAGPLPGRQQPHALHTEVAAGVEADARPAVARRMLKLPVTHENPARPPVRGESVAVDARHGCPLRPALLNCGHALRAEDGVVGKGRLEGPKAARPRHRQHVDDRRPVERELHLLVVGDARHEQLRLAGGRRGEDERDERSDGGAARHDPH